MECKSENKVFQIETSLGEENIECFADNVEFACVWRQPEVNMHIINQFLNQLNVFNDFSYDDCTPTSLTALLSASFPSCEVADEDEQEEAKDEDLPIAGFEASTPIVKKTVNISRENVMKNEEKNFEMKAEMILMTFNNTSPILFTSRNRGMFKKRRLQMN
jgi:hypothetical protein